MRIVVSALAATLVLAATGASAQAVKDQIQ
jgi:hypothetical protein